MGVDAQGDIRLGVPEALTDGDDVHTRVDELARMGVAEGMERHLRHVDLGSKIAPGLAGSLLRGQPLRVAANAGYEVAGHVHHRTDNHQHKGEPHP